MSGSDSGSRPAGYGTISGAGMGCESLAFETPLSSPKPSVIAKISVGDILDVSLQIAGGVETVAVIYQGQIAGGLVQNSERIKACISKGFAYQADVRGIQGAKVTVFVRAV